MNAFGQSLDPLVLEAALSASRRCDLFLAIGTSLTVQPAASLCGYAQRAGARLVIVNAEATPLATEPTPCSAARSERSFRTSCPDGRELRCWPSMSKEITIRLPESLAEAVTALVASDRYPSEADAVRTAIETLVASERRRELAA